MQVLGRLAGRMRVFALTSSPDRRAELRAAGTVALLGNLDTPATTCGACAAWPTMCSCSRRRRPRARTTPVRPTSRTRCGDLRWACGRPPPRAPSLQSPARAAQVPDCSQTGPPQARRPPGILQQETMVSRGRKLVYASTSGVYGDAGGAQDRRTPPAAAGHRPRRRRVSAERTWRGIAPARARAPRLEMAALARHGLADSRHIRAGPPAPRAPAARPAAPASRRGRVTPTISRSATWPARPSPRCGAAGRSA